MDVKSEIAVLVFPVGAGTAGVRLGDKRLMISAGSAANE